MTHSITHAQLTHASINTLLAALGHHPARSAGKETIYHSPVRTNDHHPSFSVDDQLGVWYDHGSGKGGDIIRLGKALWPECPEEEVILKILTLAQPVPGDGAKKHQRPRKPVKIPHYRIEEIKPLGNNPAITEYITGRGVWDAAQNRMQEVYYYVEDQKKLRKHFFAAGWQNELGGWEVRNKHFQGCLGHKAMTYIDGDPDHLVVFSGYLNYLSWLSEGLAKGESILVLNSLALLKYSLRHAQSFSHIALYLSRDQPGLQATLDFIAAIPRAKDHSDAYYGYNDYNELLTSETNQP